MQSMMIAAMHKASLLAWKLKSSNSDEKPDSERSVSREKTFSLLMREDESSMIQFALKDSAKALYAMIRQKFDSQRIVAVLNRPQELCADPTERYCVENSRDLESTARDLFMS